MRLNLLTKIKEGTKNAANITKEKMYKCVFFNFNCTSTFMCSVFLIYFLRNQLIYVGIFEMF